MFCEKKNKKIVPKNHGFEPIHMHKSPSSYKFFLMKGQHTINLTLLSIRAGFPKDVKGNVKLIKY